VKGGKKMKKKEEEKYKKKFKITLTVSIILLVILGIYTLSQHSQLERYKESLANYNENYQRSCNTGEKGICIPNDKRYITYDSDEDYAICDTDRLEVAVCVSENNKRWETCDIGYEAVCVKEDSYYASCESNEWPVCVPNDKDYVVCETGKDATCIKEDKEGIFHDTSSLVSYCSSGEDSTCIDYSAQYIANK
jgi:hypothetical protein